MRLPLPQRGAQGVDALAQVPAVGAERHAGPAGGGFLGRRTGEAILLFIGLGAAMALSSMIATRIRAMNPR
ncbi:hypothetical protein [Micromonospora sp. NPDC000442]|uniref:hypothetical protein n=1 Tax=Micromonospora sp. NPDC000442 TaxID=3364217 RepID=UPI0036841028